MVKYSLLRSAIVLHSVVKIPDYNVLKTQTAAVDVMALTVRVLLLSLHYLPINLKVPQYISSNFSAELRFNSLNFVSRYFKQNP